MALKGIDVSHWNNKTQVQAEMKNGKVVFCFVKATDGKSYVDKTFKEYMDMCDKYGVLKGAYHYAQPLKNTPKQDADNFLKQVKPYIGNILLALDWEGDALKAKASWAKEWLDYVYEQTGVKPLVYCSESTCPMFVKQGVDLYKADYGLWVAKWSGKPTLAGIKPWGFWAFHQYTNKPFDHDEFHSTRENLIEYMKQRPKSGSTDEHEKCGCKCKNCQTCCGKLL